MSMSRIYGGKGSLLCLALALALQAAPAGAQTAAAANSNREIEAVLTSKKVTLGADKKEALLAATSALPGDVIEYQATYTNKSKAALAGFSPNLPIPPNTEYQAGSAQPAATARATLGDGKYEPIPLKRKVKLPDGKEVEQEVPASRYRGLQWNLGELAPGKSVVITARVRVSDTPVAVPATAPKAAPAGASATAK
jgi:hypothetical protein